MCLCVLARASGVYSSLSFAIFTSLGAWCWRASDFFSWVDIWLISSSMRFALWLHYPIETHKQRYLLQVNFLLVESNRRVFLDTHTENEVCKFAMLLHADPPSGFAFFLASGKIFVVTFIPSHNI